MSPWQFRTAWVSALLLLTVAQAWLSVRNNANPGKMFWWMWGLGIIPLWALVSARSKELVFDGMLYDVTMCLTYALVMSALMNKTLTLWNWGGVALCIAGLICLKL